MNLSKTDTGSHGLFEHKPSEILLTELFVDRFGAQAWQMLEAFLAALGRTALPFDLPEQLRRHNSLAIRLMNKAYLICTTTLFLIPVGVAIDRFRRIR